MQNHANVQKRIGNVILVILEKMINQNANLFQLNLTNKKMHKILQKNVMVIIIYHQDIKKQLRHFVKGVQTKDQKKFNVLLKLIKLRKQKMNMYHWIKKKMLWIQINYIKMLKIKIMEIMSQVSLEKILVILL